MVGVKDANGYREITEKEFWKEIKIMIGRKFYVFTNWGLVSAVVVKERVDNKTGLNQYKVKIDIDKDNTNKDYGFWFNSNQLHESKVKALFKELIK